MDIRFRVNKLADILIWIFVTAYFALIPLAVVITEDSGMGKYILLAPLLLMTVTKIISSRGKIIIGFDGYELYLIIFALFIYASSIWANNAHYAIVKGTNMIEVIIAMYIIKVCIPEKDQIINLLKCLMWGNFGIVYYAIYRYGWIDVVDSISSSSRISSTILNANTLGLGAAFAILISVYLLLYERKKLGLLFSIPAFIVLVASESRKALFVLVFGVVVLFTLKNVDNKNIIKSFFRTVILLVVFAVVVYQLAQLPMFEGVNERIMGLINGLTGKGEVDHSTFVRLQMVEIGMNLFKQHPFLGIGMDNAKIYTEPAFGVANYYLHNNYVEILADGGMVGFIVYYAIYAVILVKLWKNRDFTAGEFNIVFLILILRLILDYGMVSYESKNTYFYLLIFYLEYKKRASIHNFRRNMKYIAKQNF